MTRYGIVAVLAMLMSHDAVAQWHQVKGCWTGSIGTGDAERRATLELQGNDGAPHSVFGLLGRSILLVQSATSASGDSLTVPLRIGRDTVRSEMRLGVAPERRLGGVWIRGANTFPVTFQPLSDSVPARTLIGRWSGVVEISESRSNPIVLKIAAAPCGEVIATIESQEQTAGPDMALTRFAVVGDSLRFEMAYVDLKYGGLVKGDTIRGTLVQQAVEFPVTLRRAR